MKARSRRRAPAPRKHPAISVVVEDARWREDSSVLRLIRRAARLALGNVSPGKGEVAAPQRRGGGSNSAPPALTILLSDDARLRALNASFRGKDKATNVLSFPSASSDEPYLGDVALGRGVVAREARAQGKSFAAHAAHLVIHGILHLTGHDHEKANDARAMEALETALLAKLTIADPYAPRHYTRRGKAA
ncbi:MAG TPA: rRNA maturation RNase YbeY [Micropepsaceae bacterium]|nr:rRNA maturation RNase YbeY [Micropepsaceae bacterium]